MTLTDINGEKFNLPALLKIAQAYRRAAWSGSDRNIVDVFIRLLRALMAERAAQGKEAK